MSVPVTSEALGRADLLESEAGRLFGDRAAATAPVFTITDSNAGTVAEISAVLKTARQNGKAIVGMKIFGAGKLIKPEDQLASLKFVFGNQLVDAITIGMLNPGEVDDTLKHMSETTA